MGCQSIGGLLPAFNLQVHCTHLYTWVERGTVRGKSLAQEHNTVPLDSAQTQITWSRDKYINHEATIHLYKDVQGAQKYSYAFLCFT